MFMHACVCEFVCIYTIICVYYLCMYIQTCVRTCAHVHIVHEPLETYRQARTRAQRPDGHSPFWRKQAIWRALCRCLRRNPFARCKPSADRAELGPPPCVARHGKWSAHPEAIWQWQNGAAYILPPFWTPAHQRGGLAMQLSECSDSKIARARPAEHLIWARSTRSDANSAAGRTKRSTYAPTS